MTQQSVFDTSTRLRWYLDAKFGLFIHWGPYSVAGAEASWPIMAPDLSEAMFKTPSDITEKEYRNLPDRFNPYDFNADEWVDTASDAGVQYIIITAKHHDGFCMFDAPGTDYKITNTPFGRDICKELSEACEKAGIRLGFYYSPPDMHHPGYRDTSKPSVKNWLGEPNREEWPGYLDYMESHIRKLLTDYGKISVIWFDGLCNHAKYDTKRFHDLIHELSPDTLINDRLGNGYDFITPEQMIISDGIPVKTGKPPSGDGIESEKFFRTVLSLFKIPLIRGWIRKQMQKYSEGTLDLAPQPMADYPSPDDYQPWETCMTMGSTWAYNPNEVNWKQHSDLVCNLSTVIGHGGNYLLNVGPSDSGNFPVEAVDRLRYIGKWISKNEASVYGTTYTPYNSMDWGTAVFKGSNIFLHVHTCPEDRIISISGLDVPVKAVHSAGLGNLEYINESSALSVTVPECDINDVLVITIETEEAAGINSPYTKPKPTGKSIRDYTESNAIFSAAINGIANGLIALFTYMKVVNVPSLDAAIDVIITIAIISFLTSWLVVRGTRKDVFSGKIALNINDQSINKKRLPPVLKGLLLMMLCSVVFGGLIFIMTLLIFPNGFSGWGYIIYKTLYTAVTGALSVIISVRSVVREVVIKK